MLLFYAIKNINIPSLKEILSINEVYNGIVIFLILYIAFTSVSPNKETVEIVSNDIGRLIILFSIVYISMIRLEIGVLLTFAYLVTLYNDKNMNKI